MAGLYNSEKIFIESATTTEEALARVCAIIVALETLAVTSAANEDVAEYWLDDGQTKIKRVYRSTMEISQSIMKWEQVKQIYINKLNGRTFQMVSANEFKRS